MEQSLLELEKLEKSIENASLLIYYNNYDGLVNDNETNTKKLTYLLMSYINKCANSIKIETSEILKKKIIEGLTKFCFFIIKDNKDDNKFYYVLNVYKFVKKYYDIKILQIDDFINYYIKNHKIDCDYEPKLNDNSYEQLKEIYGWSSMDNKLQMSRTIKCGLNLEGLLFIIYNAYLYSSKIEIVFERYVTKDSVDEAVKNLDKNTKYDCDGKITYIMLHCENHEKAIETYGEICKYSYEYEDKIKQMKLNLLSDTSNFGQSLESMDIVIELKDNICLFDY